MTETRVNSLTIWTFCWTFFRTIFAISRSRQWKMSMQKNTFSEPFLLSKRVRNMQLEASDNKKTRAEKIKLHWPNCIHSVNLFRFSFRRCFYFAHSLRVIFVNVSHRHQLIHDQSHRQHRRALLAVFTFASPRFFCCFCLFIERYLCINSQTSTHKTYFIRKRPARSTTNIPLPD